MKKALSRYIKQIYGTINIVDVSGMDYIEFMSGNAVNNNTALISYTGFTEYLRYENTAEFTDTYSIYVRLDREQDALHRAFRNLIESRIVQTSEGEYRAISVLSGTYIRPEKNIIIFEFKIECYPS